MTMFPQQENKMNWSDAFQTFAPLAMSMARGIRSGQGAGAYMQDGLAGMMALRERKEKQAAEESLEASMANMNLRPDEMALLKSMDLSGQQSYLANLMAQRRAASMRGGGGPSQADMTQSYLAEIMRGNQSSGGGMAMNTGTTFGSPTPANATPAPTQATAPLSFGTG